MARKMNSEERKSAVEAGREVNPTAEAPHGRVRFELFGVEMLEKEVKVSGYSGRVYLPSDWIGHRVKIIRVDCSQSGDGYKKRLRV